MHIESLTEALIELFKGFRLGKPTAEFKRLLSEDNRYFQRQFIALERELNPISSYDDLH